MADSTCLLYFEDEARAALHLADVAGMVPQLVQRHRFPDGELKLRLPATLPSRVVVLRSLAYPNEKLVELMLTADTARELGAQHLTLVAPYLAYMRQDIAFVPGEAVSQRIVGRYLASMFDAVVTVDPHLHRITSLDEVMPGCTNIVLSGAPLLGDWIAQRRTHPFLLGPDSESAQWVARAAAAHGFEFAACEKIRHGDQAVEIAMPNIDVRGRAVVLLDDVASSGRTLARAAQLALAAGAASVDVAVTHALFAGDALSVLMAAGVAEVWSTDCIAHSSNAVSVAPAIAQALSRGGRA